MCAHEESACHVSLTLCAHRLGMGSHLLVDLRLEADGQADGGSRAERICSFHVEDVEDLPQDGYQRLGARGGRFGRGRIIRMRTKRDYWAYLVKGKTRFRTTGAIR
jgi:hypothetical protein